MTDRKHVLAIALVLGLAAAPSQAGPGWTIEWSTLDAGGVLQASGGSWELAGTVGQWDATGSDALSGGSWTLTGGFWSAEGAGEPLPDVLFRDRFEQ